MKQKLFNLVILSTISIVAVGQSERTIRASSPENSSYPKELMINGRPYSQYKAEQEALKQKISTENEKQTFKTKFLENMRASSAPTNKEMNAQSQKTEMPDQVFPEPGAIEKFTKERMATQNPGSVTDEKSSQQNNKNAERSDSNAQQTPALPSLINKVGLRPGETGNNKSEQKNTEKSAPESQQKSVQSTEPRRSGN